MLIIPDLGNDENFRSLHTCFPQRVPDLFFIPTSGPKDIRWQTEIKKWIIQYLRPETYNKAYSQYKLIWYASGLKYF